MKFFNDNKANEPKTNISYILHKTTYICKKVNISKLNYTKIKTPTERPAAVAIEARNKTAALRNRGRNSKKKRGRENCGVNFPARFPGSLRGGACTGHVN